MQWLVDSLTNINPLKDLVIPFVAAALGIWVASWKFKRERLWQEKYASYQEILVAIEAMAFWAEQAVHEIAMLPTISGELAMKAQEDYSNAQRRIAKHATIGRLLLSDTTVATLDSLQKELFAEQFRADDEHPGIRAMMRQTLLFMQRKCIQSSPSTFLRP